MAQATFVQDGATIDYTPNSDVAVGQVVVQGELIGVSKRSIAANALGSLALVGVYDVAKEADGGVTFAIGALAYWDEGNDVAVATDGGGTHKLLGKAVLPATDGDATVRVRLTNHLAAASPTALTLGDDEPLPLGDGEDALLLWSTADASNHAAVLALGDANQALHITDKGAAGTDWNVAADSNPALYLHSNTTPATDYLVIGRHNGTAAELDVVGGTTLNLKIAGTTELAVAAAALTLKDGSVIQSTSPTNVGLDIGGGNSQTKLGFRGVTPVETPGLGPTFDESSVNSGDATTDGVIDNLRTILQDVVSGLQDQGLLGFGA